MTDSVFQSLRNSVYNYFFSNSAASNQGEGTISNCLYYELDVGPIQRFLTLNPIRKAVVRNNKFIHTGGPNFGSTFSTLIGFIILITTSASGEGIFTNCIFYGNRGMNGGALYVNGWSVTDVLIKECFFIENRANLNGADIILEYALKSDTFSSALNLRSNSNFLFGIINNVLLGAEGPSGSSVFVFPSTQGFFLNNTFSESKAYKNARVLKTKCIILKTQIKEAKIMKLRSSSL